MEIIIFFLGILLIVMQITSHVLKVKILKRIKKHNFKLYVEMLDGRPDSFIDRESPMRQPDDRQMLKSLDQAILGGKCNEFLPFKSPGPYRIFFWLKMALLGLVVLIIASHFLQTVVFR